MKIAYLLGGLNRGGTETLLYDLLKRHASVPFEMVCVHRKGGAFQEEYYQTGVPMHHLAPRQGRYITYIRQLRALLLHEGVTHVHAQQYIDGIYAHLACKGTKIQVIETFHGYDFDANWLDRCTIRHSIRWADKLCFVSECEKNYYLQKYNLSDNHNKYFVVYNGINFEKIDNITAPAILPKKNRPQQREEKNMLSGANDPLRAQPIFSPLWGDKRGAALKSRASADESVLLQSAEAEIGNGSRSEVLKLAMVGNFVSVRSQSSLRQFLLDLHNAGVTYDFYFVGKRNEQEPWRYDDCVAFCKEHGLDEVHFLGARSDVPAILQQLDAFIYATDHDTFGIAVIEAIAAGVPTFVNDWEVMNEITQQGRLATLYRTGDTDDLMTKFMYFMEHQEESKEEAKQHTIAVRELYSIETHITRLNEVYKI